MASSISDLYTQLRPSDLTWTGGLNTSFDPIAQLDTLSIRGGNGAPPPRLERGDRVVTYDGGSGIVVDAPRDTDIVLVQLTSGDVREYRIIQLSISRSRPNPVSNMSPEQKLAYYISQQQGVDTQILERDILSTQSNLESARRNVENYTQQLADLKLKLSTNRENSPSKKIASELNLIEKHEFVDKVWVSQSGNLCILTKNLKRNNSDGEEYSREHKDLGRYLIRIGYCGEVSLRVWGLDWTYEGHAHPHIESADSGNVCWGNYSDPVYGAAGDLNLYQCVDAIIGFLSTIPQPDGNPYADYDNWLTRRSSRRVDVNRMIRDYC